MLAIAATVLLSACSTPVSTPTPAPTATSLPSPTPTPNPIDSCFDWTFAQDHIHCYAFGQAYAAGEIDIEAIYQGGGALFVYLAGSDPVSDDVYTVLRSKAQEEARRTGVPSCFVAEEGCRQASLISPANAFILPVSHVYEYIFLRGGGEAALKSELGWPAFRKLWPAGGGADSAERPSNVTNVIDTSEVDTTNIPPVDCQILGNSVVYSVCRDWVRFPDLGIAGYNDTPNHAYYQVKVRAGHEDTDAEAARLAIQAYYADAPDDWAVVVPVKYDLQDYWRWAVLLDRFTRTSGNTLGIVGIKIGENWASYPGDDRPVFTEAGPPETTAEDWFDKPWKYRTTIHVITLEQDLTVAALPQLLSQLSIPADAVGVVARVDRTRGGIPSVRAAN